MSNNSFLIASLKAFSEMMSATSDLDRIKYCPQRLEDGKIYDFKNKVMYNLNDDEIEDLEVIDAERITKSSRFTTPMREEYLSGISTLLKHISGDAEEEPETTIDPYVQKILDIVAAGDKKAFREIRSEVKEKYGDDAMLDLNDAVSDKDVKFAEEILGEFIPFDTPEAEKKQQLTDVEQEIINDLQSAIDDDDETDFKAALRDLKKENEDLYEDWKDAFNSTKKQEESDVVAAIEKDLEVALEEDDQDEIKALMEELEEEVGTDSKIYKKWVEKTAPKKSERRNRRR